ncbi:MAG: amino acid adenylation domain-containing protein [Moorea sp. SIOASIH]|uniref:VatR n=1 Tax=Moorena producens ASI16Jul14-2 TaxID=2546228 RepID=A0A4P8JC73_9CYAN|nr:non-ribosomal peptide synthetase [Moorena sp. SIOASIH]NEO38504.1 amino acid adenylation domain-containing protein [Moorena sp. SIOASIH]QCP68971.1 VatR [Moorena producens ASI16Jul14-2]
MELSQESRKNKNIESIYPLSPMQEGILFHTLSAPDSGVYVEHTLFTFTCDLNVDALKHSWQQVVQRHGALRTLFIWEDLEEPLQLVKKQVDLPWSYQDWQNLSSREQQQKLEAFFMEDRKKGFQMNQAPLMRCTLIRLGNQTCKLIWSFHHILIDGWCGPIILKEVLSYYESCNQGNRCNLPPVHPYQDYILWLQQQNQEEAEEFWRQSLQGLTNPTPLVVDTTQQQRLQHSSSYQQQQITLTKTTTKALQSLVREHHLTIATLVQAAWALLLSRYSRESEVLFGVVVSGRPANLSGVEKMVGLFINTLPLRVQVPSQAQFIPWLQQLNKKQLQLQEYSYSPLVEIQRLSEIPGGVPLFQSILGFENYPDISWEQWSSNIKIAEIDTFTQTNYPLSIMTGVINEHLFLKISYDTSRFETDTIARILEHLQTLLEAMVANPNIELGQLPLMKEVERDQILVEWNKTKTDYPTDKCIHQLFEEQVENNPNAIAVVFEQQKLTYSELNSKANELAHYLQKLGVAPETLIGICVERSVEMVVGILAILKAGGVYVPLDPNYPTSRLNYMVEDAQLSIILTQEKWQHYLPQTTAQVICLDVDILNTANSQNLTVPITSEHQAYMMYTSGSTGLPKGVNIRHQGVVRLVKNTNYINLTEEDIFLQLAPISFDAATFEIWGSLLNGGTLVVMPPHQPSLGEIGAAIRKHKVTTLWLTAGLFQLMVEEQLENLKSLKQLLAGGDVLSVTHVQKVVEQLPECQLINGYGPTENTTFTCCFPVKADSNLEKSVPIGKPISNTQVYILDSQLQPVPIGVPGELYIGGDGLAIGYHNRPELTASKFIPNRFEDSKATKKLYKTGDLARYLPDGNIEFIGRIDHQVKVRGYRIETGEIEAVLNSYSQVKETVVVAREDNPGDKHLVAYIVPETQTTTSNPELSETQVDSWQDIFNQQIYDQLSEVSDPLFNTRGWISNYDNQPIPVEQMRIWAGDIVSQVLAHKAESVWEVGCGTGMLLFQIAPQTEKYYGTDISNVSLEYIKQQIEQQPDKYGHVSLAQKRAEDMADIADNSFDVVLLSSIVQYFPSVEYLLSVIENSIRVVKPGGMIFLGDIRSLPLMKAFHSSVQLYQATPSLSVEQLKQKIDREMERETELLVSPELFVGLKEKYPEITHVQIRLQRGSEHNELNKYRYSVLLHIEAEPASVIVATVENGAGMSYEEIETYLRQKQPESICFSGLVNSRVASDVGLVELLSQPEAKQNIQQLRQKLESKLVNGIDPERLYELSASLGYSLELCWSAQGRGELMDGVFVRSELAKEGIVLTPLSQKSVVGGNWHHYGNNPLSSQLRKQLRLQLREYLESRLPEYMVPSELMVLSQLPLTPNGKVDRKALPVTDVASSVSTEYIGPETEIEKVLAEIWQDVLGIEKVGIHDSFIDLGGHSLTAVKLVSKISTNFNIILQVKTLLLHPRIDELSNIITELLENKNVSQHPSTQSINNEVQETLNEKVVQTKNSEYLQFEPHSLSSLFSVGKIHPVDAAALGYLRESDAEMLGWSRDYIIENIFENLPFCSTIKQTNWGRIALISLPLISDLYSNQDDTVQVIIEALEMAAIIGAKFVSLTGLIPSATDYGLAITKAIANRQDLPKITTGHRTTGAAVVLSIKKICEQSGRDLSTEKVGFIGLGSVGMNVLPLMLKCLPHPQEITLCDVYSKLEFLENIQQELVHKFDFKGQINLALSKATVPEKIYDSTLIVGATNVADVLDIMQVKPGTLIVDDSGPHCFSVEQAIQRFQEREDILFSEGGMLRSPFPIKTTVYLPPSVEKIMNNPQKAAIFNSNPFQIMGCAFSGLLSSQFEQLEPTVGICDGEQSQLHYQILQELEFEAGDLHCEQYVLPPTSIANFRHRFGKY